MDRLRSSSKPPVVDSTLDFTGERALERGRSHTWEGTLRVAETGDYMLMSQSWGGAANLYVDDVLKTGSARLAFNIGVPKRWSSLVPTLDNLDNGQASMRLEAGKSYRIRLAVEGEPYLPVQVRLAWVTPEMRRRDLKEAVALASKVDTPIVFAWAKGGESFDPDTNLSLPHEQDALIDAVASVNPNTIVVLNTGIPGHHALAQQGEGYPGDVVPWPGGRACYGRRAAGPRRAGDCPSPFRLRRPIRRRSSRVIPSATRA